MNFFFLLVLLISSTAMANLHLAPPDFESEGGRNIFVDFKSAEYSVVYDLTNQKTSVKSKIIFKAAASGRPMFDLVPRPRNVRLNGENVRHVITRFPGRVSKLRIIDQVINSGEHVLEMENEISSNVIYHDDQKRISSAFWIRDLMDRLFLEQYVPSNFEFDQYKMTLNIEIKGVARPTPEIFTNGLLTQTSASSWKIEFPEYFTVSCPYFHMTPKGKMQRLNFTYTSINGRKIPITVYSPYRGRTRRFKAEAIKVMQELEADYGPWGHPSFVAYGTMGGTGGMEHAGATATSFAALDHEMLHSYFAKGVMPANGNTGWIDEAIASWRDKGYLRSPTTGFSGSDLGAHSVYTRSTDKRSYALGAAFMAYLDFRLQDVGGLKSFLRGYFQTYKHTVITTEHFKNNLEFFSGLDLSADFETYIWGKNDPYEQLHLEENPNHVKLIESQLISIL
jgi:hypothetical protein